jgi:hypothetical protein
VAEDLADPQDVEVNSELIETSVIKERYNSKINSTLHKKIYLLLLGTERRYPQIRKRAAKVVHPGAEEIV